MAELQLGFWTILFESHYEQRTRLLPWGIKAVLPRLPKSGHNRKALKRTLEDIRAAGITPWIEKLCIHWPNAK